MSRPFGVTLVGILVVLSGLLYVVTGVIGLFSADMRAGFGLITLILILVIGLIYLAVANGLFAGNNFSRLLVGLFTVISLLIGIFELIFISGARWHGLWAAVFSLIILGFLFSRNATLFFTRR